MLKILRRVFLEFVTLFRNMYSAVHVECKYVQRYYEGAIDDECLRGLPFKFTCLYDRLQFVQSSFG